MVKKKKYDTNPLDPDFPQKVSETPTAALPNPSAETQQLPYAAPTEEQTRRFGNADFPQYSSPFDGQSVPQNYQTAHLYSDVGNSTKRKIAKVGLPENMMVALPYLPYVGLVAGILELLFVPRTETKVRFHAAQGLAAHLAIWIVATILSGVGNITSLAGLGNMIFSIVTSIMLIVWTIKAWKGKPVHIESVDDLTNWLDEKIKPLG